VLPQLARSAKRVPTEPGWAYEPKWDGFRALAFVVDGELDFLQSRNGRPLKRYFPELAFGEGNFVLDGEVIVRGADGTEDFDALGQRIHPAASRIERLAGETPAVYVAFDLLAEDDEVLLELSFEERRTRLEAFAVAYGFGAPGAPELTPLVREAGESDEWFQHAEGVIAKELAEPYRPGERKGMTKIKRVRTIDAVVKGWRPGKEPDTVGSLILGLYDEEGRLAEMGHSSGFTAKEKRELVGKLQPHETGERGSGEPSRWQNAKDLEWIALRPELVVEITFDHTSGRRIRHGAKVQRWREDKDPRECTLDQLRS
jgi:ATP-dependent DNA ligase